MSDESFKERGFGSLLQMAGEKMATQIPALGSWILPISSTRPSMLILPISCTPAERACERALGPGGLLMHIELSF